MAPGTTVGAAHPIEANGNESRARSARSPRIAPRHFRNPIAHQRGRNEAWYEEAVRKSSSISEREALKLHVIDYVAKDIPDLLAKASGRVVTPADGHTDHA